jgi:ATP-binding cassette, subfamily B, bacterial
VLATVGGCDALLQLADGRLTASVTADLRGCLLRQVLALGRGGSRRFPQGDMLARLIRSSAEAATAIPVTVSAVTQSLASAAAIAALGLISPLLLTVPAVGVPLGAMLARTFNADVTRLITGYQETLGQIASHLSGALDGITTISAAGTWTQETERIISPLNRLRQLGRQMWRRSGLGVWRSGVLLAVMQVAVLAIAGVQVAHHQLTPGGMLAAVGYLALGYGFLGNAWAQLALARARASAGRLSEVMAAAPLTSGHGALPPGPGELEFRRVCVYVPNGGGERLLNGLDLLIPGGRCVAVVGRSGAGKSTLAALAVRLIDADEGEVLLDGQPLPAIEAGLLRGAVAFAPERPVLFGTTVADAIGPGTPAALRSAALAADAHSFISRMPHGYQTPLAEAPLSGGERQRLGLARAIAHGGRLVVLDDATASLDAMTERLVRQAIADSMPDRTKLVVAHRAATASSADLVAWLHNGRIRALAPHDELWPDPEYRDLFGAR